MFDQQRHDDRHPDGGTVRSDSCASRRSESRGRQQGPIAQAQRWVRLEEMRRSLASDIDRSPTVGASDVVQTVGRLSRSISSIGWHALDAETWMDTVSVLETARRQVDAAIATGMGLLERNGVTRATCGLGAKSWIANARHGSAAAANRDLTVAKAMDDFPLFAEALRNGDVSVDHLIALDRAGNPRVRSDLIDLEVDLVDLARRVRYRYFVSHLRNLVALLDQDGPAPDCSETDSVRLGKADGTGTLYLNAILSGHNAVTAERLLSIETDRQYRQAAAEFEATGTPIPPAPILRARALMVLLRDGAAAPADCGKPRTEAVLPITVDHNGQPIAVHTDSNESVHPHVAAMLICDAFLQPIVTDRHGHALFHGRERRLFTPAQKRAMLLRDGGCVFPGCSAPAQRCDAHHTTEFQHGGLTNLDQGVLLCRRHHGLVHSNQPWRLSRVNPSDLPGHLRTQYNERASEVSGDRGDPVFVWTKPDGATLLAQTAADHRPPQLRQTAA